MKEPQPEEQASFKDIELKAPSVIRIAFMSWPPISKIKSTPGLK